MQGLTVVRSFTPIPVSLSDIGQLVAAVGRRGVASSRQLFRFVNDDLNGMKGAFAPTTYLSVK